MAGGVSFAKRGRFEQPRQALLKQLPLPIARIEEIDGDSHDSEAIHIRSCLANCGGNLWRWRPL